MSKIEELYYLACGFLYGVCYHYFDYIEDIEIDDLQSRLARHESVSDEIAWWLLDEMKNGGNNFLVDGEKTLVHACTSALATNVHKMYQYINQVSQNEKLTDDSISYYLYYLESGWLKHILPFFEEFIKGLHLEDVLYKRYLQAKHHFQKTIAWLEEQLIDVSKNYLPQDQLAALNQKMEETNQKLTKDWLQLIEEASNKFSPNI